MADRDPINPTLADGLRQYGVREPLPRPPLYYGALVALTQLLNVLLGGYADETTSSRAYRRRDVPRWHLTMLLIDRLFWWQVEHCRQAYESEVARRQMPPELRGDQ